MNEQQKAIIRVMSKHSIGAIFVPAVKVNGGWIFPNHIRNMPEIGGAVAKALVAQGVF